MDGFISSLQTILNKHYPKNEQPEGPADKVKSYNEKVDQFIIDHLQASLPKTLPSLTSSEEIFCLVLLDLKKVPITYLTLVVRHLKHMNLSNSEENAYAAQFKTLYPYLKQISKANLMLDGKVESLIFELGSELDNMLHKNQSLLYQAFPNVPNMALITAPILMDLCKPLQSLTPLHQLALKHAIYGKLFRNAKPLADKNLGVQGDKLSPYVNTLDFLTFYYYSGIIHINLSQFEEAIACFEMLLVVPPQKTQLFPDSQTSKVQIEGYKKFKLCQLASTEPLELPEQMDKTVKNTVSVSAMSYESLVKKVKVAYPLTYLKDFSGVKDRLKDDGNLTTAQLVLLKCKELALTQIHKTYYKLTLDELAEHSPSTGYSSVLNPLIHLAGRNKLNFALENYTIDDSGQLLSGTFQFQKVDLGSHKQWFHQVVETLQNNKRLRANLELQELAGVETFGKLLKKKLMQGNN